MFPNGVIYESGKSGQSGEFVLRPKLLIRLVYHALRGIAGGVVAFAIVGLIFSYYPIIKEEISYQFRGEYKNADAGDLIQRSKAEELGLDPFFSIYIPKIDAKARVIANVNPGNYKEYTESLQLGVAHAGGTNFPGQDKLIYLFSHSTDSPLNFARYNAVFYLLRKLEVGDEINLYFLGEEYKYRVQEKMVVEANDNSWLKDEGQGETLILQTCDPPGTTFKRLLVVAKPLID